MNKEEKTAQFWDIAKPMLLSGRAQQGTMMGFPCLRTDTGQFFASLEKGSGNPIIKVPAQWHDLLQEAFTFANTKNK